MNKFIIPEPCHQNWENMLPEEKGRFCTSCKTKVYDLSQSSDEEIQELYEAENGNMCGKFGPAQSLPYSRIQKVAVHVQHFTHRHFSKFGILVSAASLLLSISGCGKKGDAVISDTNTNPDTSDVIANSDNTIVIGEVALPRKDSAQIKPAPEKSKSLSNENEVQPVKSNTDNNTTSRNINYNNPDAMQDPNPKPSPRILEGNHPKTDPSGSYPLGKIAPRTQK